MTREEKLALAGDYVLGLLDTADRLAFEAAITTDPELAAMAATLAERLHALDDTAGQADYDPALWGRIERQLGAQPATMATIVPLAARKPRVVTLNWLPLAASVLLALGAGYLAGIGNRPSERPTVVAVMLNETDGTPAVVVEAFADDSIRLLPLVDITAPAGQVLQVWTLPDAGTGPVSLGTLPATQDLRLAGPDLPLPRDGQLYEITLEPAPGSPTGRPTGPVLVKGLARSAGASPS